MPSTFRSESSSPTLGLVDQEAQVTLETNDEAQRKDAIAAPSSPGHEPSRLAGRHALASFAGVTVRRELCGYRLQAQGRALVALRSIG